MKEKEYFELVNHYPKTVVLDKVGYMYTTRGEAAYVLGYIMDYKIIKSQKNNIPITGGPALEKITDMLDEKEINYIVVESNKIIIIKEFDKNHFDDFVIYSDSTGAEETLAKELNNLFQIDRLKEVEILLNGISPWTDEIFEEENIINCEEMKVLLELLKSFLLESVSNKDKSKKLPTRAGSSWSNTEDKLLKKEFEENYAISKIAKNHERTRGAIKSRLRLLGLID